MSLTDFGLWLDLSSATRTLRKQPGFTILTIVVLALGLGANAAMFSLLDAIVLRSLPIREPGRLVLIDSYYETGPSVISYPLYREFADQQTVFTDVVATRDYAVEPLRVRLTSGAPAQVARGGAVTANYFDALGLTPALGRWFAPLENDSRGPAAVAVVSHDFWQRELEGTPAAVGRSITINEVPFTIIGVAPAGFHGMSADSSISVWVPLTQFHSEQELNNRFGSFFRLSGRLKPDITLAAAAASATQLLQRLRGEERRLLGLRGSRRIENYRITVEPGAQGFGFLRERLSGTLRILVVLAGVLLLVVCVNLTTLLSIRIAARRRDMAVRQAVGASRLHIVRQLLAEHLLLATAGVAVGLLVAMWGSRVLLAFVSTDIALHSGFSAYVPDGLQFKINLRVLGFTAGLAILAAVLLAFAPTAQLRRAELVMLVNQRSNITAGVPRSTTRLPLAKVLVAAQVALTVALLVGAGLMLRTVLNLRQLDPGFDPERVLMVDIDVTGTGSSPERLVTLEERLDQRLSALPGIRSASLSWISLFGDSDRRMNVTVPGEAPRTTEPVAARLDAVSPNYFDTVGLRVVAGRVFTRRDNAAAPPVAVVNEVFVRRFFSGGNPIGRTFIAGPDNVPREVVGVVRDAKYNDLRQQALEMFYVPLEQWPASPPRSIQLRASGRQVVTTAQVAQALRDVDPAIVLLETKTLEEQMGRTFMRERLLADLSMFFAGVSLLVACLGLYSVLANQVLQRIREIGLRVALGSTLGAVVWMVVRDALLVVGIGVLAGIPLAIGLSNSLTPQLFGVTATDPFVFAAGVGLLLAVAVLAAVLPARAAATVDPVVALSAP